MRARLILLCLLGMLIVGWFVWRKSASGREVELSATGILKQPVVFATHTFDPASPPPDMPPPSPGEAAACDSNFVSNASIRGDTRQADPTHGTVTITHVKMTLRLRINVWLPSGASQHLIDHEDGHRQISEYYYQDADKVAERIAASYIGKRIDITGADLTAESGKVLQQTAAEIADEYNKTLNPEPTQLLYDSITDHGRNDTVATDAVTHALKNVSIESTGAANTGH